MPVNADQRSGSMNEVDEKRRFTRFEFQETIRVFPVQPSKSGNIYEVQKEFFEARASDICEGGLGFEAKQELDPSFLLKINFDVPVKKPVEVYGKVVWAKNRRYGVRFMYTDQILRKGVRSIGQRKTS